jgi:hypothetical protein
VVDEQHDVKAQLLGAACLADQLGDRALTGQGQPQSHRSSTHLFSLSRKQRCYSHLTAVASAAAIVATWQLIPTLTAESLIIAFGNMRLLRILITFDE